MKNLLSPIEKNGLKLKNKVVMAPMTRSRATGDHIPTDIMAPYYAGRASAGLIVTEGVAPSANGVGYARIPGIYNAEQVSAWKPVTDAVHAAGGRIFVQLMHTGRVSHPGNMPPEAVVLGPSAIPPSNTKMYVDGQGMLDIPTPKEMTGEDIAEAVNEYVVAARNAVEAGFDGIELHAANGYLLEQFLNPHANQRDDEYGGSKENRSRMVLEVVRRTVAEIGAEKVGIRFSPNGSFNDVAPFEDQKETFDYLAEQLDETGLAYIHLVDHGSMGATPLPEDIRESIREKYRGNLILSGGYDPARAETDLQGGKGDLVAFGRPFIANPDLIDRWQQGAEMNEARMDLLYTPGEAGYTDYPTL